MATYWKVLYILAAIQVLWVIGYVISIDLEEQQRIREEQQYEQFQNTMNNFKRMNEAVKERSAFINGLGGLNDYN